MKYISLICLTLGLFLTGNALAQAPLNQINVSGSGAVKLAPTGYKVTFTLQGKGDQIAPINATLERQLSSVVSFLLESGVPQAHIQSMQLSIQPNYEHSSEGRRQNGFVVRRDIQVSHNQIENYDTLIDGVIQRGVFSISGFSLTVTDNSDAYNKALRLALTNARSKAELVSQELSVELGEVVAISETSGNMPVPIMRSEAFARDMPTSLPGERTVTAHVNVSFAINQ